MIQAVLAGIVSTLLAPRIERAWSRPPAPPGRVPNLSWTTWPRQKVR